MCRKLQPMLKRWLLFLFAHSVQVRELKHQPQRRPLRRQHKEQRLWDQTDKDFHISVAFSPDAQHWAPALIHPLTIAGMPNTALGKIYFTQVKEKCWALKEKDAVAAPDQWTNNYNTQCRDFRKKDMWNNVQNGLFLWTSVSPSEKWEWPQKCLSHTVDERHIKNSPHFIISGHM